MSHGMQEWFVVLEATATSSVIDPVALRRVITELDDWCPSGLYDPNRYAVQARVKAASPAEALLVSTTRWRNVATRLGFCNWELVRAELLTPEEYDWECDHGVAVDRMAGSAPPVITEPEADSARRTAEESLLRRVFHDEVTGLVNKALFDDRLEYALARATEEHSTHAVLLVAIDDFSTIASSVGVEASQEVLMIIASLLRTSIRATDTAARVGADEFALLLEDTSEGAAIHVADRVAVALRSVVLRSGREVRLTVSVGLTVSEPGKAAEEVVGDARLALDVATRAGGGQVRVFDGGMARLAGSRPQLENAASGDASASAALLQHVALAVTASDCHNLEEGARDALDGELTRARWPISLLWPVGHDGGLSSDPVWLHRGLPSDRAFRESVEASHRDGDGTLVSRVLTSARPMWTLDAVGEDATPSTEGVRSRRRTTVAFPVLVGSEVVAVVQLFADGPFAPDTASLETMAAVGRQLGQIVERGRARAAIEEVERRSQLIASIVDAAVILVDRAGTVLFWNREAEVIFGYSVGEIVGRNLDVLLPDASRGWLDSLAARSKGRDITLTALHRDQTPVPVQLASARWDRASECHVLVIAAAGPEIREVIASATVRARPPAQPPLPTGRGATAKR